MSTNHFTINTAFITLWFGVDTHVFDAEQAYRNILIYFVPQEGTCTTNHYSHRRSFIMYFLAFLMIGPFGLLLFRINSEMPNVSGSGDWHSDRLSRCVRELASLWILHWNFRNYFCCSWWLLTLDVSGLLDLQASYLFPSEHNSCGTRCIEETSVFQEFPTWPGFHADWNFSKWNVVIRISIRIMRVILLVSAPCSSLL
jgi:hypothetical protein